MSLIRLIFTLAIFAALAIFTTSNWTTPLAIVFLGFKLPGLPLAVWVLSAIAAGALTSLILSGLMRLSNQLAIQEIRSRMRAFYQQGRGVASEPGYRNPASDDDAAWKNWDGYEEPASSARASQSSPPEDRSYARSQPADEPLDDWERPPSDDWERSDRAAASAQTERRRDLDLESQPEPQRRSQSGSSYSYSYREPGESGVGKAEKVVDADYRVIVPPYRPLEDEPFPEPEPPPAYTAYTPPYTPPVTPPDTTSAAPEPEPEENADDWFEDEDTDWEKKSSSR